MLVEDQMEIEHVREILEFFDNENLTKVSLNVLNMLREVSLKVVCMCQKMDVMGMLS